MRLDGERIYLTSITDADTEDIIKWRNNAAVKTNFIFQNDFTYESHTNWLNQVVYTGKAVQFIINENKTNQKIGSVFLKDIDPLNKKAEYGIFIGEITAQGKGYGTEAAKLIIRYGMEVLKLHKIYLRVFAQNQKAIRSYEKAGFVQEAYLKDDVIINNHFLDIVLMAVYANEVI